MFTGTKRERLQKSIVWVLIAVLQINQILLTHYYHQNLNNLQSQISQIREDVTDFVENELVYLEKMNRVLNEMQSDLK